MIDNLKQIEEKMLLSLLSEPEKWNSLLIDYHPPLVERLYTQIGNYRLYLHFIHECEPKDALFHPHPWPSAMHVLYGKYEMGLGFGSGNEVPEKMCTILLENGGAYYDMTHIDGWHYVRPVGGVCASVMLTGKPWGREELKTFEPLKPLDNSRKIIMLDWFSSYYKKNSQSEKKVEKTKIERGNWVVINERLLGNEDKKEYAEFIGKKGFVIKSEGEMVDIRFGSDRVQIESEFLKLLTEGDKPKTNAKDGSNKPKDKNDDWLDIQFI